MGQLSSLIFLIHLFLYEGVYCIANTPRTEPTKREVKQQHFSICLSGRKTFYFVNANPKYQEFKFIFFSYKNWILSYYKRYELFASKGSHFLPILQNVFDGSFKTLEISKSTICDKHTWIESKELMLSNDNIPFR